VKAKGGKVFIFSSLHVSGEQLHQLGGVAAILRFPMEIENVEEEEEVELFLPSHVSRPSCPSTCSLLLPSCMFPLFDGLERSCFDM